MNLWLRFLWVVVTTKLRGRVSLPFGISELDFRVHIHDIDLNFHMNNGRYLTIMDLGRIDFSLRSGIWGLVVRHRWMPVANAIMIRFRRELPTFEPFRLTTRLLAWNETHVVMEQVFTFTKGERRGQIAAHALFRGAFYDRKAKAYVSTDRLIGALGGSNVERPKLTPEIEAFLATDDAMRSAAKAASSH